MMKRENIVLLVLVVLLAVFPLVTHSGDFAGADDRAKDVICEANPDYRPWAKPWWEPPSAEVESLLFALQAALGAGFIGYYFGLCRGRRLARHS